MASSRMTVKVFYANPEAIQALEELAVFVTENPWCGLDDVLTELKKVRVVATSPSGKQWTSEPE